MLACVIWLTVGTSTAISSESPAVNDTVCVPAVTCLLPCSTRQTRGREMSYISPLGVGARISTRPSIGVWANPSASVCDWV